MGILVCCGENGKKSIGKDGWGLVGSLTAWLFTLVKPQKSQVCPLSHMALETQPY